MAIYMPASAEEQELSLGEITTGESPPDILGVRYIY
jgi:hypothetical protein